MRAALIAVLAGLACGTALAQQANVNLDYNPQKNTENLIPFSAPLNSPGRARRPHGDLPAEGARGA